jgi:hypothetical protein
MLCRFWFSALFAMFISCSDWERLAITVNEPYSANYDRRPRHHDALQGSSAQRSLHDEERRSNRSQYWSHLVFIIIFMSLLAQGVLIVNDRSLRSQATLS